LQSKLHRAEVFINKLEAARRQLDAAIRMTFTNADELATHTVAAASYRILRDLLYKRGRSDQADLISAGIIQTAQSIASGTLSPAEFEALTKDAPQLEDFFLSLAERVSGGDELTVDEITVRLDGKSDWNRLSTAANFLKHADRDSDNHLSLDSVNNDELLIRACAAYAMAVGQTSQNLFQTPEMSAFHIWWMARHDPPQLVKECGSELADLMQRLSPAKRRRTCLKLIRTFAQWRMERKRGAGSA